MKLGRFRWRECVQLLGIRNFNFIHKEVENSAGGVLVAWNKGSMEVLEVRKARFSISLRCRMVDDPFEWVFYGVYGPNGHAFHSMMWEDLNEVQDQWRGPWCLGAGGDFIVVKFPNKKRGTHNLNPQMVSFSEFINDH